MPQSIPANLMLDALRACAVRSVVTVPDTHQRTLLDAIAAAPAEFRLVTCSTEEQATCVAAGLWIGGDEPIVLVQHVGLYASVNTLRGVALDGRIPTFYLVGLLGREPERAPRESAKAMVRQVEPLLDAFGVPHALLDGPEDLTRLVEMFRLSRERRGPTAALVGVETC